MLNAPLVGGVLRRLADLVDPPEPELDQIRPVVQDRQEAALSLMDDEVVGFVLVQVRANDPTPEVTLAGSVDPEHWLAVGVTLRDIAKVAYGVG